MLGTPFYNATIKRIVSVFGTLFNNIQITRYSGGGSATVHVPISYGPRKKFLARIQQESNLTDKKVAIKLPRLSFEMTSIDYDSSIKLNKLNKRLSDSARTSSGTEAKKTTFQSVPYNIGMQLNIYANNQDDALQIVEQILPTFNPEYTIAINDIDGPNSKTDVPFILTGVSFSDDYEGELTTRRTILYTLDFTIKAKFAPGTSKSAIIKRVQTEFADFDVRTKTLSQLGVSQNSPSATIREYVSFINPTQKYNLVFSTAPSFAVNELIIGNTSLNGGNVVSVSGVNVVVDQLEGLFTVGETIAGNNSPAGSAVLSSITEA